MGFLRVKDMTTLLVEDDKFLGSVAMGEPYGYGISKGHEYDFITVGGG